MTPSPLVTILQHVHGNRKLKGLKHGRGLVDCGSENASGMDESALISWRSKTMQDEAGGDRPENGVQCH